MKWNWILLVLFLVNGNLIGQVVEGKLLANWKVDTLIGSSQYNNIYNEVWGLHVNDSEYAIIGSTAGTHFVNIDDPENPREDFFVQGTSYGSHIIHRDFHDYNGYLYIVSDEDIGTLKSAMQIVDISQLPEKIELVYESDDRIRKAHNIFIDSSQAKLYGFAVKGGDDPYSPLRIYDISDPLEPIQMGEYRFGLDGVIVGHYHDGFVRDNIAYLNAGLDGLVIADLTDPDNPELLTHLSSSDYPESGYNHSGWLSDDGKYYFMGDETWGTAMKVFDVSDPRNVELISRFDAESDSDISIAHNQIVHCNYLFASYYYDGLQVFDIRDPERPIRAMQYSTTELPHRVNYEGAWGVYPFLPSGNILVSDMQNGLFIIEGFTDYCALSDVYEQELNLNNVVLSPNPSKGDFLIESAHKIDKVLIFNSSGVLVKTFDDIQNKVVNVDFSESGIYFVSVISSETTTVKKIIIQE
jgi:choice-of-anchor B domain-containing protein